MSHILYKTHNIQFYLDESVPCLVNEWCGFIKSEDFRAAILKLVDILKQQKTTYPTLSMLADTRTLGALTRTDLEWVTTEINPLYVGAGVTHEAFLLSQNAFGNSALNRYTKQTTTNGIFTVQLFDDMEKAKAWLKAEMTDQSVHSDQWIN